MTTLTKEKAIQEAHEVLREARQRRYGETLGDIAECARWVTAVENAPHALAAWDALHRARDAASMHVERTQAAMRRASASRTRARRDALHRAREAPDTEAT